MKLLGIGEKINKQNKEHRKSTNSLSSVNTMKFNRQSIVTKV